MGHRKKPGAPNRTTIPAEIVSSATKRLLSVFRKRGYNKLHYIFIIPQQCYLYVEVESKPFDATGPEPPMTKGSTTHKPWGRLKYTGNEKAWVYQPYRWSDEYWDERNMESGTPEDLMLTMIVENR